MGVGCYLRTFNRIKYSCFTNAPIYYNGDTISYKCFGKGKGGVLIIKNEKVLASYTKLLLRPDEGWGALFRGRVGTLTVDCVLAVWGVKKKSDNHTVLANHNMNVN